jgi:hypothetical protein
MLKYLIFFLIIINVHGFTLFNDLYMIDIDDNKLIIKNHFEDNINVTMKYEQIYENNITPTNNYNNILFNYFLQDISEYYHYIGTTMKKDNMYFDANYEMNNYITNVQLRISGSTFDNMATGFIISLSFNSPINYDGKYILEIKDYIIQFNEYTYTDDNYKLVTVERFGNNFYLHFPYYEKFSQYQFMIKKNEN